MPSWTACAAISLFHFPLRNSIPKESALGTHTSTDLTMAKEH